MNKKKTSKPYWQMTTAELGRATKKFDQEFIAEESRPLTAEEQALLEEARAKPARAENGQTAESRFPDAATVTETGPGGQQQVNRGHSWGAILADGTPVRVLLTALVRTTKIPVLTVGQVIHVVRHPWDPTVCSVDPADFEFVSPSRLERRTNASSKRKI